MFGSIQSLAFSARLARADASNSSVKTTARLRSLFQLRAGASLGVNGDHDSGVVAFAKTDSKAGSADKEPEAEATSPATPAMTPLSTDAEATPVVDEPVAQLPEDATDTRFSDKQIENVLVTGATGGVGKKVVEYLTSKGVQVVAMVKDTVKADKLLPTENVTVVQGNVYQYADVQNAIMGVDAVVCASGTNQFLDPFGPFSVDFTGTVNIVEAGKAAGVKQMVLVSSIGTDEPIANPANIFWGILFWKKRGEEHLQRSGLPYTIVRPGGLVTDEGDASSSKKRRSKKSTGKGAVVMGRAGTYGFPPKKSGAILRSKVAECVGEALVQDSAMNQVVEIVADEQAPAVPWDDLFSGVY
eukprot:jgi/Ulvmu1/5296/UM022_0090.1